MWDKICQVFLNANQRLEIFGAGPDTTLWHNLQNADGKTWAGWAKLGQPPGQLITSGLAAAVDNSGGFDAAWMPDVQARGADSALWHLQQASPNVGWAQEQWQSLGGVITSDPVSGIFEPVNGLQSVFARGTDNALHVISQSFNIDLGVTWVGAQWVSLGGVLTSGPAVAVQPPAAAPFDTINGRDVYVRGTDSAVHHIVQDDLGNWGPWEWLGGALTSDPAVIANEDGNLEVFGRGTDMALWHKEQTTPGDWTNAQWRSLGGALTGNPVPYINVGGRLEVFARGTDSCLYHISQSDADDWTQGGAGGWQRLGTANDRFLSDPAVAIDGSGLLNVFAQGTNNALWQIAQLEPGDWAVIDVGVAEFVSLGGSLVAQA
jgi:hypothetical protein